MSEDILLCGQVFYKNSNDVDIYEKCTESLKKFGYKTLIVDSSQGDLSFNKNLCDYYLYDKENRLFDKKTDGLIYFYYENSEYRLKILCEVTQNHELNILYQNTKAFNLAKILGYKYVLRLECDTIYSDENVRDIKEKIKECLDSEKKAVFVCENEEFLRLNMSFWDIDWYLEKIGNIRNEKEWEDFLNKYGFENNSIEFLFYEVFKNLKEEYLDYDKPLPHYLKTFKYKETERFYKSDVIIDFFKDGETLFFCVLNQKYDTFPKELILNQYLKNGGFLTNTIGNPGSSLVWVIVDSNVSYVDLIVDGVCHRLNKSELFSSTNELTFH